MKFAIRTAKSLSYVFIAILFATSVQYVEGQEHKAVNLGTATGLPFSDGIIAGNTLYIAGQEGTDSGGNWLAVALLQKRRRRSMPSRGWSRRQVLR